MSQFIHASDLLRGAVVVDESQSSGVNAKAKVSAGTFVLLLPSPPQNASYYKHVFVSKCIQDLYSLTAPCVRGGVFLCH